ncbi:MAG: rRNA maturation RNase YbeY [Kiritimatiellae bacterium]|nr:rRNA maturation RNase YbeY [Kiritimatiellia bacterium]
MKRSIQTHNCATFTEITLVLTDDSGIRDVHQRCFGQDSTTDVISLNYDAIPGEAGGRSGELFVNLVCAWQNARKTWAPSQELALYIAHGCDHLAGATDDTSAGRQTMRRRELRWLREAAQLGLLDKPLLIPADENRRL